MKQKEQVIKYFKDNQNKAMHFKTIANELNILVPNMRRILGQGTLKDIFTRVSKGVYKLNEGDNKPDFKNVINKNVINNMDKKTIDKIYNILQKVNY
tara:strand:+ start:398 stop:688 length:291 start_codon:yes stop_codon:yes gene_type:complete